MELSTSTFWAAFWVFVHHFFPELDDPNLKTSDVPQYEIKNAYDFVIVGAGAGGCVVARRLTENPDWTVLLIEAGREEDAKSETPLFSPTFANTDFDWNYTTVRQTRSCLSNLLKAYLNPVRHRPNLHVIKKSRVIKIIFDGKRRKAKGVKYIRKKKMFTVNAKREVILSAGTVDTPKLLMLSGIGPRDTLKKHKTEVISDLPVGKHFQDHVQIQLNFEINKNVTITSDVWKNSQSLIKYTKYKEGPLAVGGGEAIAFFNSLDRKEIPNTEIQFYSFLRKFEKPQHKQIVHLIVYLLNPKSVGTVTLKSNNPFDPPLIDPNFLDDVYDFDSIFKSAKIAFQYMNTPTMSEYSPRLYLEDQKLCKDKKTLSEVIICIIKYYSYPGDHGVGTARMGPAGDPEAVVTPQLIVRGFDNLRVVDASIMPFIPRGNTMAATVAVAEKASDIIKHYHSLN